MAPRKEKSEKQMSDQGSALVLEYLRKQNRPYSATDISSNLHNKVTKTNAAKHLKDLHDSQKIECRVSGKQVVYHALQEAPSASTSSNDDLAALDDQLTETRSTITYLKSQEKLLKQELSSVSSLRSFEELKAMEIALQTQKEDLAEKINILKAANKDIKPVSEAERLQLDAEQSKWSTEASLRGYAVKGLWSLVASLGDTQESSEMSKEDLWEHIGCEGPVPH